MVVRQFCLPAQALKMSSTTLYLGLDVHKDSIVIAIAEPGPKGEIRLFGTITNDLHALEKALSRIRKAHPKAKLEVSYEAGPCGNSHQRWILTECAEYYAIPPKIRKELSRRQEGQPESVRALSWKAQNRPLFWMASLSLIMCGYQQPIVRTHSF
jgi:hypothetical protein